MSRDVLATIDVDAESDEAFERRVLAVHDLRDPARLANLADDDQDAVRRAVAGNLHTPAAVLEAMAADQRNAKADGVLAAIALNENVSDDLLRILADGGSHVRHAIWYTERVRDVFTEPEHERFSKRAWRVVVVSVNPRVVRRCYTKSDYDKLR